MVDPYDPQKRIPIGPPGGSSIIPKSGRRNVKEYPITESELNELSGLQGFRAAFLAIGSTFLGVWFTIFQALGMSGGIRPGTSEKWSAYMYCAIVAAVICYGFAAFYWLRGHTRLGQIKGETDHGE